ncbi:DUF6079 family protein [Chloroflexota bacterium]
MTTHATWNLLDLPPGQHTLVVSYYQGIEYPGEIVTTLAWETALGQPLQNDCFFRIVFLRDYAPVDSQELRDARIAVCVPPRREQRREELERRVLREFRARYAIPATEQALHETQRQLYASGNVVSRAVLDIPTRTVFESLPTEAWVPAIAQPLLAWSYPRLPLDSSAFPRPLSANDAGLLFRGLIQADTAPEVRSAVEAFGTGLGLTPTVGPEGRLSQDCPVFHLLRSDMTQQGGSWPCSDLYQRLAHVHGLPYPLISLYLLAFLHSGHPPAELHLRSEHRLRLREGTPYQGRVVVAETVRNLDFVPRLEAESQLLRYAAPVSWNTLVLYFSPLEPSLTPQEEVEAEAPTLQLMETLRTLQADVQQVERALERLAGALGEEVPEEAAGLLDRFHRLGQATAPETALQTARQLFGSPQGLAQAMAQYRVLRQVSDMARIIGRTARYLQGAHVPEEMGPLMLQRQTLQATLRLSELTATSFSDQVVQDQIARFQEEYRRAYLEHHGAYHREAASLLSQLREARLEAQALEQLNGISEMGEPVDVEALEWFQRLFSTLTVCPTPSIQISLNRTPRCRRCGLKLGQQAPSQEVAAVIQEVGRGLKEQNRRLSLQVVRRILRGPVDERVQRFIQVVQASDVSGLVNVLDDSLVAFLREVLSRP